MKLSEAIRLGAMLKPQAFGTSRDGHGNTCALGAAEDAAGCEWTDAWSAHPSYTAPCPACGAQPTPLTLITVAHLNDVHRWTREAIADWVETIEAQQAQPAPLRVTELAEVV